LRAALPRLLQRGTTRTLELTAMASEAADRYEVLHKSLLYAVHELPAGVLFGPNGATEKECKKLMDMLLEFEQLAVHLGKSKKEFIEGCRWHFEHYPHYLGRSRHFTSYQQYIEGRRGPLTVESDVRSEL
jgi:hypothetical protein